MCSRYGITPSTELSKPPVDVSRDLQVYLAARDFRAADLKSLVKKKLSLGDAMIALVNLKLYGS